MKVGDDLFGESVDPSQLLGPGKNLPLSAEDAKERPHKTDRSQISIYDVFFTR